MCRSPSTSASRPARPRAGAAALAAVALLMVLAGCGTDDKSCSEPGAQRCDFWVEALMVCSDLGEGRVEWRPMRVCPAGLVCVASAAPEEACQPPGGESGTADAQTDADGPEVDPRSVQDFVDRMFPGP